MFEKLDLRFRRIPGRDEWVRPERFNAERANEIISECKACAVGPWSDNLRQVMTHGETAYVHAVWDLLDGNSAFIDALNHIANGHVDAYLKAATSDVVKLRCGKSARLSQEPFWDGINEAWFVIYDLGDYRFSLYWPSLTYFPPSEKNEHNLDAVLDPEQYSYTETTKGESN